MRDWKRACKLNACENRALQVPSLGHVSHAPRSLLQIIISKPAAKERVRRNLVAPSPESY